MRTTAKSSASSTPTACPPREQPPFDRDRHLPQAPDAPLIDDETPLDSPWLADDGPGENAER